MARLQILQLPEGAGDERPPFILVVDQTDDAFHHELGDPNAPMRDAQADLAKALGARAVLVFRQPVEIPANDTTAYLQGGERTRIEPDETQVHATEGLRLAHERTDIARDADRLVKWKNELTDALGMDRTRDWDDIRNAAAGLRKERDAKAAALERVRALDDDPEMMDAQHPDSSGYLHGYRVAISTARRATWDQLAENAESGTKE